MQLIDAEKAAPIVGLEKKTQVYEAARKNLIPHVRIGRKVRFDPERLKEWARNGGTPVGAVQPASVSAEAA